MISSYYLVFLCAIISGTNCEANYLPPYIHPCDIKSDKFTECVREQIETSLPEFTKGIRQYDVPSIDPVHLDDISIDGNGLKLTFTDTALYGLKDSKLSEFKVKLGQVDEDLKLAFKCNMSLTANYDINGKILILPILGNGPAVVKAQNVEVKIESKLTHVKDAKGEHLKLSVPTYTYTIEKTTFDFQNLFNGNKQLAETTLKFANENWQQLMDELSPPAIKQIVKTIIKAINKFFAHVTIQQIVKGYKSPS